MSDESFEGVKIGKDGSATVDLSGVSESAFPVIPAGMYDGHIREVEYSLSSNGNRMWTWHLEIDGGEYGGRRFFYHTTFTEKGINRVKKALKNIGMTDLLNSKFDPEDFDVLSSLADLKCRMRLKMGTYLGDKKNDVKDLLPPGAKGDAFLE